MADKKNFEKEAQVFKALAHPTRLLIINTLLEEGEKCVFNIQDLLKASQPNISQHLKILKYADIVDFRQQGNLRCYFLKYPKKIRALLKSTI
jgi:DNA-binding transcriptional ArsR family regulator